MDVKQIYAITNSIATEVTGGSAVLQEDLSNLIEVGSAIFDNTSVDNFVKSLMNHIGKVIFVNRPYTGSAPSVLMDGWEYGSVLQKIHSVMPTAVENETWELVDGTSYDPNVFHKPTVDSKFYNNLTTFEIDRSLTNRQVKESFSSAGQLNAFLSMLENETQKALTVRTDALIMRTINNMIAETFYDEFPSGVYGGTTSVKARNLLYEYNQTFNPVTPLTASKALITPEFIRFAALQMSLMVDRLGKMSNLFSIGGLARFTPSDMLHIVTLSEFQRAADTYLQSDTFHNEFTRLPKSETVPFWQGCGTEYGFTSTSAINVKCASNSAHTVEAGGILCAMFDRDALGVNNFNKRVETHYNPKVEFTNYFYKQDARYFNDMNENFVVFYIADAPAG